MFSGECVPHAQGSHLLRRKMEWSIYFERGTEVVILYYFTSFVFPLNCNVGGICMFWNICLSFWHQWWCNFGAAICDVYGDIRGCPLHILMWIWRWYMSALVLFRTHLMRLLVSRGQSRRWNIVSPSGQGSCGICCNGPSLVLQSFIGVHVGVLSVFWWRIHKIYMQDSLV